MEIKIPYAVPARFAAADSMTADGEIGRRFDIFAYERISSDFAIREILKEAEDCIRDKYDDENVQGLWRCEFWGKQIISAVRVCRMKEDGRLKEEIRRSAYRVLSFQNESGYLGSYKNDEFIRRADPEACRKAGVWDFGYNWSVWGTKYTMWGLLECALLLDDENIVTACRRMADQLCQFGALPVGDQRVQGQVHRNTTDMTIFHRLRQGLGGEILGALPCIKLSAAKIHGICAVLYRCPQSLHRPCRRQKFQHKSLSPKGIVASSIP